MNFLKSIIAHIFAISIYLANQTICSDSSDHVLQNDIQHVLIFKFGIFRTSKIGLNLAISRKSLIKLQNVNILSISNVNQTLR